MPGSLPNADIIQRRGYTLLSRKITFSQIKWLHAINKGRLLAGVCLFDCANELGRERESSSILNPSGRTLNSHGKIPR